MRGNTPIILLSCLIIIFELDREMAKRRFRRADTPSAPTSGMSLVMEIEEAQRRRGEKRDASMSPKVAKRRQEALNREEENARKNFLSGRRLFFGSITIIIMVTMAISGINILELHKASSNAEQALIAKQEEKVRLESEYAMINNLDYIETQARERLKMIKPGEILYIFDEQGSEDEA